MPSLASIFEAELGAPFPLVLHPRARRLGEDCLLWASPLGALRPILMGQQLSAFRTVEDGYFFAGFWGYGSNSYAFYWALAEARQRVYLRLPYGGAYMDPKKFGPAVLATLRGYAGFWTDRRSSEVERLEVTSVMGSGETRVRFNDGRYAFREFGDFRDDPFAGVYDLPRTEERPRTVDEESQALFMELAAKHRDVHR